MIEFPLGKMVHLGVRMLPGKICTIQKSFKIFFFRIHYYDPVRLQSLFFQPADQLQKPFLRLVYRDNNINLHS